MRRFVPFLIATFMLLCPAPLLAGDETQSVIYDKDNKEMTSSALIKLLNKKLGGVYQDLELVITSCFGGEVASRAGGANGLQGDWSVSTATDIDHGNTTIAGKVDGAGNFNIGGSVFNGWLPAWISKLTAEGNKIGNKALAEYATAEKQKAVEGSSPQYNSSGKAADDMTVHGGKKSNHAIVFQTTGFVKVLDGVVSALESAGYTDAEINRIADRNLTWDKFGEALDDLRKKLDANPKQEKALISIQAHGSKEERTVAYAPGHQNEAAGGAVVSAASAVLPIEVIDPVVLATLGQDLPKPTGGVFSHDPLLARYGPANLRFSTFEEHLVSAGSVGITLNGLAIGALDMGVTTGGDYQLPIPDEVLSQLLDNVMQTGVLNVGFSFASSSDWVRLATPEDWADPTYANLDYGIGIAANCCDAQQPIPEPSTWALLGLGLGLLCLRGRRRRAGRG